MQQIFNQYPALYGTDDILYHIGRFIETIANKETPAPVQKIGDTNIIISESDPTNTTVAQAGDLFLNTTSKNLYEKSTLSQSQFFASGLQGIVLPNSVWVKKSSGTTFINAALSSGTIGGQNYGGGLFKNSSFELNSLDNFPTGAKWSLDDSVILNGLKSLKIETLSTDSGGVYIDGLDKVPINPQQIYKVSYWVKSEAANASVSVRLKCFDKNKQVLTKTQGDLNSAYDNFLTTTEFTKRTSYLSGLSLTTPNKFHPDTVFASLRIYCITPSQIVHFNQITIEKVPLGEPVPYTISSIPVGQMVYDPATNDVGRYNGTDINWFM